MALRLRPRDPSKHMVGNAILYGGEFRQYNHPADAPHSAEVFYVETDFGSHMTLTWGEVEEMFTVAGFQPYDEWLKARDELRSQLPLNRRIPLDD